MTSVRIQRRGRSNERSEPAPGWWIASDGKWYPPAPDVPVSAAPPPYGTEPREGFPKRAWRKYRSWPLWVQIVIGIVLVSILAGPFTTLFEMVVPAVSTARTAASLLAGSVETQRTESSARELLTAVEAGGWRLEHASYVWEQTGAISRDKFMSSGQVEEVTGQALGFYLFRRVVGAEVDYTAPPEVLEQVRFLEAATGQRSVRFPEVRSGY